MKGVHTYINQLKREADNYLTKEYHLSEFPMSNFELINFYLIDKAINKNHQLFIKTVNREDRLDTYIPTILSVAISLFFKNYCIVDKEYRIGDIVQKNGFTFEIVNIVNGHYKLKGTIRRTPTTITATKDSLDRNYLKVKKELSSRRSNKKLNEYKKFYKSIFKIDTYPTVFPYKGVIILEGANFESELRELKLLKQLHLRSVIPYCYVNGKGKFSGMSIPLEPMIYITPSYDSFYEYILNSEKKIAIDTLVVIGNNKYRQDDFTNLSNGLRDEDFGNVILIGSDPINDDQSVFKKWAWTITEHSILHDIKPASISIKSIYDESFQQQIQQFEKYIKQVEDRYSIKLLRFTGKKKLLYSLVLPNKNSRLRNQLYYVQHLMLKRYGEEIDTELFNQGLNSEKELIELNEKIKNLIDSFSNIKRDVISTVKFDFIVLPTIPREVVDIWNDENNNRKILSYNDYKNKLNNVTTRKKFLFLSPFGYKPVDELFDFIRRTNHDYTFLAYEEEARVIRNLNHRYEKNLASELNSKFRKKLTGVEYPFVDKPEEFTDILDRIDTKIRRVDESKYISEDTVPINYKIQFMSGESLVLEGSKSVLVELSSRKKRINVANLKTGDRVHIYSNLTKELLITTARNQDESGVLSKIEQDSKLWKQSLKKYYEQNNSINSHLELLEKLKEENISISSVTTVRNWLNVDSNMKFPQSEKDLLILRKIIQDRQLNHSFQEIIRSRKLYNGIMIALGRDLSDEVMDYIVSKSKGRILSSFTNEQIETIANTSAPLRIIKSIEITEDDETE